MGKPVEAGRRGGARGSGSGGGNPDGVVGLQNLGTSCFFNAVCQNLASLPALRAHYASVKLGSDQPMAGARERTAAARASARGRRAGGRVRGFARVS